MVLIIWYLLFIHSLLTIPSTQAPTCWKKRNWLISQLTNWSHIFIINLLNFHLITFYPVNNLILTSQFLSTWYAMVAHIPPKRRVSNPPTYLLEKMRWDEMVDCVREKIFYHLPFNHLIYHHHNISSSLSPWFVC